MRIGVIIPSFRSNPKIINQILLNIDKAFINIGIKADVLLIDLGSSEDLYRNITNLSKYLNSLNLRVIKLSKDRGLLYMRQIGVKSLTHCDYILFVDNDVIPHVDVINQAIKLAETDARIGAVTAILKRSPIPYFDISFSPISFRDYPQRPLLTLNPIGGFFLLSRRALQALFLTHPCEIQFWYEDVSIGLNLLKLGLRTILLPIEVWHVGGLSYRFLDRKNYSIKVIKNMFKARVIMIFKYNNHIHDLFLGLILLGLDAIRISLAELIKRNPYGGLYPYIGLLLGLFGFRRCKLYRISSPHDLIISKIMRKTIKYHLTRYFKPTLRMK